MKSLPEIAQHCRNRTVLNAAAMALSVFMFALNRNNGWFGFGVCLFHVLAIIAQGGFMVINLRLARQCERVEAIFQAAHSQLRTPVDGS